VLNDDCALLGKLLDDCVTLEARRAARHGAATALPFGAEALSQPPLAAAAAPLSSAQLGGYPWPYCHCGQGPARRAASDS